MALEILAFGSSKLAGQTLKRPGETAHDAPAEMVPQRGGLLSLLQLLQARFSRAAQIILRVLARKHAADCFFGSWV